MVDNCEEIQELLLPYINRELLSGENSLVIFHLAACSECRRQAAQLIKLSKEITALMSEVPNEIIKSAYAMISEDCKNNQTIENMITNAKSPFAIFEIINYVLLPVRKTISFALQSI
jgi:predicted anti-sigma-YlaC factor YlaD